MITLRSYIKDFTANTDHITGPIHEITVRDTIGNLELLHIQAKSDLCTIG